MPFEQRTITSTYFICGTCQHEHKIPKRVQYSKIYSCTKEGCDNQETFLGLSAVTPDVSLTTGDGEVSFFKRLLRNNIFQAIVAAVLFFILLQSVTYFINKNLISD